MTQSAMPICEFCKHFNEPGEDDEQLTCEAYPNGIPFEIVANQLDHRQSLPGDNDVQFEAKNGAGARYASDMFGT